MLRECGLEEWLGRAGRRISLSRGGLSPMGSGENVGSQRAKTVPSQSLFFFLRMSFDKRKFKSTKFLFQRVKQPQESQATNEEREQYQVVK